MKKLTNRFVLLALMLSVALSLTLTTTTEAASKAPKKITLKATKTSVTVGKKVTVKVKSVKPKNASKAVTFKSSNKKIATVSSKGTVTGKKAGKVTITATSKKNKKVKAKIKITVKDPAPTKLTLSTTSRSITIGSQCKVSVKSVRPKNASKAVSYSSSNKAIASVTQKGVIKGISEGTVKITATSTANRKIKASVVITVKKPAPTSLGISATCKNIGKDCTCTVSISSITPGNADNSVSWSSSDDSIATVTDKGLVTGIAKGTVTITATSKVNKNVKASVTINVVNTQQGTVTNKIDLSNKEAGKVAKVWLPIPKSDENQTIKDVKVNAPYATKIIDSPDNLDSAGNRVCYIEWGADVTPTNRIATLSYHVFRKEVVRPELVEEGTVDKAKFAEYLKPNNKSGSFAEGSLVKTTADRIVAEANAKTVLEKAKAIFDWEVNNLHRDNSVTGCGLGDVEKILTETKGGKCTDLNSVFVALLRAEGIPAREMFGIRINANDITGNQHCRAQFYLPGTGWVEADPADVLKQALSDGKENTDADWLTYIEPVKDKYWGGNNEKWVMLSMERDITLTPAQSAASVEGSILNTDGTLNNFGYPYGEIGSEYIPCYSPSDFTYTYSFNQDTDKDCCY